MRVTAALVLLCCTTGTVCKSKYRFGHRRCRGVAMRHALKGRAHEDPQVLKGWKTIAEYLGMAIRTVQRYEHDLQLPIQRTSRKSSVFVTKAELDAWVSSLPTRDNTLWGNRVSPSCAPCQQLREEMRRMRELRADIRRTLETFRKSRRTLQNTLQLLRARSN